MVWTWFSEIRPGIGTRSYSLLSLAAIRSGSYQSVLVVEFFRCLASKEKNKPGLPEQTDVKSHCQRRVICQTN